MTLERLFSHPLIEFDGLARSNTLEHEPGDILPNFLQLIPRDVTVTVNSRNADDQTLNVTVRWNAPDQDVFTVQGYHIRTSIPVPIAERPANARAFTFQVLSDNVQWIEVRTDFDPASGTEDGNHSDYVRVLREDFMLASGFTLNDQPQNVRVTAVPNPLNPNQTRYTLEWDAPDFTLKTIGFYRIRLGGGSWFNEPATARRYVVNTAQQYRDIRIRIRYTDGTQTGSVRVQRADFDDATPEIPTNVAVEFLSSGSGLSYYNVVFVPPATGEYDGFAIDLGNTRIANPGRDARHHTFSIATGTTNLSITVYARQIHEGVTRLSEGVEIMPNAWGTDPPTAYEAPGNVQATFVRIDSTLEVYTVTWSAVSQRGLTAYETRENGTGAWTSHATNILQSVSNVSPSDDGNYVEVRAVYGAATSDAERAELIRFALARNLRVTRVGDNSFRANWDAPSSGTPIGYRIQLFWSSGAGSQAAVNVTGRSWNFGLTENLVSGAYLTLRARYSDGNSATIRLNGNTENWVLPPGHRPAPSAGLRASARDSNTGEITWAWNSLSGINGYEVSLELVSGHALDDEDLSDPPVYNWIDNSIGNFYTSVVSDGREWRFAVRARYPGDVYSDPVSITGNT